MPDPVDVYLACRVSDTLFAMNPYLPQQNFYSQQLRALALVTALRELHLHPGRRNVCVVGAGVAGRTLAAAFVSVGASVTLIDKRYTPFEQYRNAGHRELHPNIIFWPDQVPTPVTALPFLNWAQAPADVVTRGLLSEWKAGFADKVREIRGEVAEVVHNANGVELKITRGSPIFADLCVLATGFQHERTFGDIPSPGYWSPTAVCDESEAILVSGSGDGGLIDILAPILGTRVTKAAHVFATAIGNSPLTKDVAAAEKARREACIPNSRDSTDPCDFYKRVRVSNEVAESIRDLAASEQELSGRTVTLLHKSTSPYSFTAAPINKLLLAHFSSGADAIVETKRGSLNQVGKAHMMQPLAGAATCVDPPVFDTVLVRHGADPASKLLLTDAETAQLVQQADDHPDAAALTGYDRRLFRWTGRGMGRSGVTLSPMHAMVKRALKQLGQAYELDIVVGKIKDESFTSKLPIEVDLDPESRVRADRFRLFPLQLGPAKVIIKPRTTTRNAPYDA